MKEEKKNTPIILANTEWMPPQKLIDEVKAERASCASSDNLCLPAGRPEERPLRIKKNQMNKSLYEIQMSELLKQAGYKFQAEYKFCPTRKFRFDFTLEPVKTKIAIEVEGEIWTGKGRHSRGQGFINDCEKYNLAQIMGWIVLRYTPETLPDVLRDLELLMSVNLPAACCLPAGRQGRQAGQAGKK